MDREWAPSEPLKANTAESQELPAGLVAGRHRANHGRQWQRCQARGYRGERRRQRTWENQGQQRCGSTRPRVPGLLRAGGTGLRARSLLTEAPVPVPSSALEGVTVQHQRARCCVRLRGSSGGSPKGQGSWPSLPPVIPPALAPGGTGEEEGESREDRKCPRPLRSRLGDTRRWRAGRGILNM